MWLVCIDAHSKYPYTAILEQGRTTAKDTVAVLEHFFLTEGTPLTIVTDNGPQFTANKFEQFCTTHGIKHITSAPFHPASNGEAERFVQSLKRAVEKNCIEGESPKNALQLFLTTYRCLPHPNLEWKSPEVLDNGRQPRNPLSLLHPRMLVNTPNVSPNTKTNSHYSVESMVYAQNYATGPGKVIGSIGNRLFKIRTDRGIWKRHSNQLQPRLATATGNAQARTDVPPTSDNLSTAANQRRYPVRDRRRPDYYDSARH